MRDEIRHLQRAIPDAWEAFLGRFPRPTPIQTVAIPVLATGAEALVVAPAASGKTEAVVAPLCQRLLADSPSPGPRLLYLVPTRALANDIEARLREPCGMLGIRVAVRTGDRPTDLTGRECDLLVTTPESLDSMLCRYPDRFRSLVGLVLDEVHLLHRTCRGEQTRILMRRLARWHCPGPLQRVAMSATVGDPASLGLWLFDRPMAVLEAGAPRPLDLQVVGSIGDALALLRREGFTKALWFCNSRKMTEEVAQALGRMGPWPPHRVLVHHASLSRRAREEAERAFRRFDACLMVATSTLEWGVDVGNVDAVVLVGAPDSTASFIQRVGRGCRRRQGLRAIGVVTHPEDRLRFTSFQQASMSAPEGLTDEHSLIPGVVVQQVFSMLFGRRQGVGRNEMLDLLTGIGPREDLEEILDHLVQQEWIVPRGVEHLQASTRLMDLGERGRIHSNLMDETPVLVIDATTGRPLGQISQEVAETETMALGGRSWRVTSRNGARIQVAPVAGESAGHAFAPHLSGHPLARYLPERLRTGFRRPPSDSSRT